MDTNDLAYLAGLIDGEGSINICAHTRSRGHGASDWWYEVSISNTNAIVVKRATEIIFNITGRLPSIALNKRKGNRRPCFHVRVQSKATIVQVLTAIRPFLSGKGAEADLMLLTIAGPGKRIGRFLQDRSAVGAAAVRLQEMKSFPWQVDAEVILQGLRSGGHRNDYGVSPNNNPRTSARPASTSGDDIVCSASKDAEVTDKEPWR